MLLIALSSVTSEDEEAEASAWFRPWQEVVPREDGDDDDDGASRKRREWVNREDGVANASAAGDRARSDIRSESSIG